MARWHWLWDVLTRGIVADELIVGKDGARLIKKEKSMALYGRRKTHLYPKYEEMLADVPRESKFGSGYECLFCGRDLTPQIDDISKNGHGDGADGTVECRCSAVLHVIISIKTSVILSGEGPEYFPPDPMDEEYDDDER